MALHELPPVVPPFPAARPREDESLDLFVVVALIILSAIMATGVMWAVLVHSSG